jgi:hypothetical protein
MEKLDFTPEEWREWREQEGLGWPPESGFDFVKRTLAELRAKYPDHDVDAAIRRSLDREYERRRAKEIRDEIAQLELRREQAEDAIRNNLFAELPRSLGRETTTGREASTASLPAHQIAKKRNGVPKDTSI